jgi:hypothetical protein
VEPYWNVMMPSSGSNSTFVHLEVEYLDVAAREKHSKLGSRKAQLAAKPFWGAEMLQQRMDEMAARNVPLNSTNGFPSLRHHPRAFSNSPCHSTETSDSESQSSLHSSPLLPERKRNVKHRRSSLTNTLVPSHMIQKSNSEDDLECSDSLQPLSVRLGSKEAKLASTSFWGHNMLQQRLEEIACEKETTLSPKIPHLPPVTRRVRPQSSMARLPSVTTSTAVGSVVRRNSLSVSTPDVKGNHWNNPITPLKY